MGGNQSRESPDFESGIYLTPHLVAQLQGKPIGRRGTPNQASLPTAPLQPSVEQSVARRFKADQELRRACDESTLAGDLLLKAEGEELERVNQYADELMKKEYRIPSSGPPCLPERDRVTDCYKKNIKDPLLCAELVDAYANCADQARKAFSAPQ